MCDCGESPVAKIDMAEAFKLLAQRIRHQKMNGAARWLSESGNTGPASLPIKLMRSNRMFGTAVPDEG